MSSRLASRVGNSVLLRNALLFCLALITLPGTFALYGPKSPVRVLSLSELYSEVHQSTDLWIIEFFASWCGHCKSFAPEYEKAAAALKGIVNVVAVENESALAEYGIKGFPTIMGVIGKGGKQKPKTFTFVGTRTAQGVVDFALQHAGKLAKARLDGKLPSAKDRETKGKGSKKKNQKEIKDFEPDQFKELIENPLEEYWLVAIVPKQSEEQKSLRPQFEELVTLTQKGIRVGWLECTETSESCQKFNSHKLPQVILYPQGSMEFGNSLTYTGSTDAKSMAKYANQFVSSENDPLQLTNNILFGALCKDTTCILAILPSMYDSTDAERVKYLNDYAAAIKVNRNAPMRYLWAEAGQNLELEKQLQMEFGYPAVVALNLGKGKYSIHRGNMSKDSISSFIIALLSGNSPLNSLPQTVAKIADVAAWEAPSQSNSNDEL